MIRNVDPEAYRLLKARAAAEGRTIGEVVSDAIRRYVHSAPKARRTKKRAWSVADLPHWDFGPGSEDWSERFEEVLYGGKE